MKWFDDITDYMDMNLSKLPELVMDQRALERLLGWEREGSTDCTLET